MEGGGQNPFSAVASDIGEQEAREKRGTGWWGKKHGLQRARRGDVAKHPPPRQGLGLHACVLEEHTKLGQGLEEDQVLERS